MTALKAIPNPHLMNDNNTAAYCSKFSRVVPTHDTVVVAAASSEAFLSNAFADAAGKKETDRDSVVYDFDDDSRSYINLHTTSNHTDIRKNDVLETALPSSKVDAVRSYNIINNIIY